MEKQAWKEFYVWLETASQDELIDKKSRIFKTQPLLQRNKEIYNDSVRMIDYIDQELLARCL